MVCPGSATVHCASVVLLLPGLPFEQSPAGKLEVFSVNGLGLIQYTVAPLDAEIVVNEFPFGSFSAVVPFTHETYAVIALLVAG